jgi:hypothetical protein
MSENNEIVPGTGAGSDDSKIVFMEEPKTADTSVQPAAPEAPAATGTDQGGYYTSKSRKLVDLFIGFFGLIALNASQFLFPNASASTRYFISQVTMILSFVLLVMSFKMRRGYIGGGMFATLLLPVLFVLVALGSCFFMS